MKTANTKRRLAPAAQRNRARKLAIGRPRRRAPSGVDAKLTEVADELVANVRRREELSIRYTHLVRMPPESEAEDLALTDRFHDLTAALSELPAPKTQNGALALLTYTATVTEGDDPEISAAIWEAIAVFGVQRIGAGFPPPTR